MTNSTFTESAIELAEKIGVELWDDVSFSAVGNLEKEMEQRKIEKQALKAAEEAIEKAKLEKEKIIAKYQNLSEEQRIGKDIMNTLFQSEERSNSQSSRSSGKDAGSKLGEKLGRSLSKLFSKN